jgi:hypothetical protein
MNKNGTKVNRAQLKDNELCLKDFQKGNLVIEDMTFDECTVDDRKGRVLRSKRKTVDREERKCESLEVAPPFAFTDSATVNAAAMDGALALMYKIFGGPPVLDANLRLPIIPPPPNDELNHLEVDELNDLEVAQCQLEMLERAGKLETAVLKEVLKAKRKALKDETVNSAAALEAKLQTVFFSNNKISKAEDSLVKLVDQKCDALAEPPNAIFAGICGAGNPDLAEVEDCVIAAARCEVCLKFNAFDDLNLDCDQMDDQNANASCTGGGNLPPG